MRFLMLAVAASLGTGLVFSASPVLALEKGEHVINIFRPEKVVHPIALQDFLPEGSPDESLGTSIPGRIAKDLEFTGLFRPLDRESYLEKPGTVRPNGSGTSWDDWTVLKATVLVRGGYRLEEGDRITSKVWVFSVEDGATIGEFQATDTRERLPHRLADAIYKLLTGEESCFGSRLAFVNNRTGSKEIWYSGFDGSKEVQVTRNRSINLAPSWNPKADRLIFTSYVRNHPDMYFYDLNADKFYQVSSRAGINIGGAWSPHGRVLAVTLSTKGNADIYLMREDGKGAKRLTKHYGLDVAPSWAPDGRQLAFVSDRGGNPNIYAMDVDGSKQKRLTFEGNGAGKDNQSPSWSPRGDRIAFQSRVSGAWQIFTMKPDGSHVRQITSSGSNEDPVWSPDGRMIAFIHAGKLWVMEADGTNARAISTGSGTYSNVSWSPRAW